MVKSWLSSLVLLLAFQIAAGRSLIAGPTPSPVPSATPTPVPLELIVAEADKTTNELAGIQKEIDGYDLSSQLYKFIPDLTGHINPLEIETARTLTNPARSDTLQRLAINWIVLHEDIDVRRKLLDEELGDLDASADRLAELFTLWTSTQTAITDAPPATLNRIASILRQIADANAALSAKRTQLLGLQSSLSDQQTRITRNFAAVRQARRTALIGLLTRDGAPLWDFSALGRGQTDAGDSFVSLAQARESAAWLYQERGLVALHLLTWLALIFLFRQARSQVHKWVGGDPSRERCVRSFEIPGAAASVLAISLGFALYAGASALIHSVLGAALLVPLIMVINRVVESPLKPVMWGLAGFYLVTQIREAVAPFALLARVVHLAEMLGGLLFVLWLLRRPPFSTGPVTTLQRWVVSAAARLVLVIFTVAAVANVLGYVNLAIFIGSVTVRSAYAGILLHAVCHIADCIVVFSLKVPPLGLLSMARHHHFIERRLGRFFRVAAFFAWVAFTLEKVYLLAPVISRLEAIVTVPFFGHISIGSILIFLLTVWVSFLLSRFIRFVLEEDIYRHLPLKPGLPFAISTILHYCILLLGFYLAVAILIGDANQFTILLGAFGLGIGFGLQNIVNNFASSLIVLCERPIKIGDYVQIGGATGTVQQIGVRATVLHIEDGSEIIIPNANLISDPVVNWTRTDTHRRVEIDITITAANVEARHVIELLEKTAAGVPAVCQAPPPQVVVKFAPEALSFELRVWTLNVHNLENLRTELAISISEALAKNNIAPA